MDNKLFQLSGPIGIGTSIVDLFKKNIGPISSVQKSATDILGGIFPQQAPPAASVFNPGFTDKLLFTVFATVVATVVVKQLIK